MHPADEQAVQYMDSHQYSSIQPLLANVVFIPHPLSFLKK